MKSDVFVSVDVEADGPIPGDSSEKENAGR